MSASTRKVSEAAYRAEVKRIEKALTGRNRDGLTELQYRARVCKFYGWSYTELMDAPAEFVDHAMMYMAGFEQAEAYTRKQANGKR